MIYKFIFVLALIIFLGWIVRDKIIDYGRAWYFGIPFPTYSISIDHSVYTTLTDGVRLVNTLYRPKSSEKFPAILARTPYGRENEKQYTDQLGKLLAGQGFVFVIQDVRGKSPSEGEFYPHVNDAKDGSETISWIINQPWSNGEVALFGFSYLGVTAWQAFNASTHKISTIVPCFSGNDPYHLWHEKDVLYLKQLIYWMAAYSGSGTEELDHQKIDKELSETVDWKTLDERVTGKKIPAYQDFLAHSKEDGFWLPFSTSLADKAQETPVLFESGWYDQFLKETIEDFSIQQRGPEGSKSRESRLIIGPWAHIPTQKIEGLTLGSDANFLNQLSLMLKWYQHWMGPKKALNLPPVTYYLMGKNKWMNAESWPPQEATSEKFYLNANAHLSETIPKTGKRILSFQPQLFVPSIGGRMLYGDGRDGPQDQGFLEQRKDVIFWTSPPLKKEIVLVGAPKLTLHLTKTPKNFDLSIKLIDRFENGSTLLVTEGYFRVEKEEETFSLDLNLTDIAYVIPANHRLELAITHSDFPGHEPNKELLNKPSAEILFLTGEGHSSYLEILKL